MTKKDIKKKSIFQIFLENKLIEFKWLGIILGICLIILSIMEVSAQLYILNPIILYIGVPIVGFIITNYIIAVKEFNAKYEDKSYYIGSGLLVGFWIILLYSMIMAAYLAVRGIIIP